MRNRNHAEGSATDDAEISSVARSASHSVTGRAGSQYHGGGGHCLRASTLPGSPCRAKSLPWRWDPSCTEAALGTTTTTCRSLCPEPAGRRDKSQPRCFTSTSTCVECKGCRRGRTCAGDPGDPPSKGSLSSWKQAWEVDLLAGLAKQICSFCEVDMVSGPALAVV